MKVGKITRVVSDRNFFFIDEDYFCHNSKYPGVPEVGQGVKYEPFTKPDGKKEARNVKQIDGEGSNNPSKFFEVYLDELKKGYFFEDGSIDKVFLIDFPQQLAEYFKPANKITQVYKFFNAMKVIESKYKVTKNFFQAVAELYTVLPLVNNACKKRNVSKEFYLFMGKNIEKAVESPKSFQDGFIKHFQSLVGYYI